MTTFGQAVKSCLNQYCGFKGRASRAEYWWFILFCGLVSVVLVLVDLVLFSATQSEFFATRGFHGIWTLAMFLPSTAVLVRRLHDTGKSAWWLLLYLTLVGIIVLFVFVCLRGNVGSNKFGEDPYGEVVNS